MEVRKTIYMLATAFFLTAAAVPVVGFAHDHSLKNPSSEVTAEKQVGQTKSKDKDNGGWLSSISSWSRDAAKSVQDGTNEALEKARKKAVQSYKRYEPSVKDATNSVQESVEETLDKAHETTVRSYQQYEPAISGTIGTVKDYTDDSTKILIQKLDVVTKSAWWLSAKNTFKESQAGLDEQLKPLSDVTSEAYRKLKRRYQDNPRMVDNARNSGVGFKVSLKDQFDSFSDMVVIAKYVISHPEQAMDDIQKIFKNIEYKFPTIEQLREYSDPEFVADLGTKFGNTFLRQVDARFYEINNLEFGAPTPAGNLESFRGGYFVGLTAIAVAGGQSAHLLKLRQLLKAKRIGAITQKGGKVGARLTRKIVGIKKSNAVKFVNIKNPNSVKIASVDKSKTVKKVRKPRLKKNKRRCKKYQMPEGSSMRVCGNKLGNMGESAVHTQLQWLDKGKRLLKKDGRQGFDGVYDVNGELWFTEVKMNSSKLGTKYAPKTIETAIRYCGLRKGQRLMQMSKPYICLQIRKLCTLGKHADCDRFMKLYLDPKVKKRRKLIRILTGEHITAKVYDLDKKDDQGVLHRGFAALFKGKVNKACGKNKFCDLTQKPSAGEITKK